MDAGNAVRSRGTCLGQRLYPAGTHARRIPLATVLTSRRPMRPATRPPSKNTPGSQKMETMMLLKTITACAAVVLAGLASLALPADADAADKFPSQPIRLVLSSPQAA